MEPTERLSPWVRGQGLLCCLGYRKCRGSGKQRHLRVKGVKTCRQQTNQEFRDLIAVQSDTLHAVAMT